MVGRFSGPRGRTGERELSVVYTKLDGGFNNGAAVRRVAWSMRASGGGGGGGRECGGFGRTVRNLLSCFWGSNSDGYKVLGLCTDADADVDAVVLLMGLWLLLMVCGQWSMDDGSRFVDFTDGQIAQYYEMQKGK
ncbi:hypothetical protein SO802_013323 [Lithocarpus litseifolius]|uniref:DUF1117 domain-containing protein n=1 Tax=Lithocarpus litseifolius TaxID=425828 RepID=A0AAW2D7H4_9ROSI